MTEYQTFRARGIRKLSYLSLVIPIRFFSTSSIKKMEGTNRVKTVLKQGERPALGVWQMLPGSNISRLLARAGYDWVLVDCEHGNIDGQLSPSYSLHC